MPTIISVFADRAATHAAVDELVRDGIPASRIKLHEHTPSADNTGAVMIDEYVSGGLLRNLLALFDGVFDHHVAEGCAETYADVVRSEGTLLSVEAAGEADVEPTVEHLRKAGARRVSTLPAHDSVSFHRLYPDVP